MSTPKWLTLAVLPVAKTGASAAEAQILQPSGWGRKSFIRGLYLVTLLVLKSNLGMTLPELELTS